MANPAVVVPAPVLDPLAAQLSLLVKQSGVASFVLIGRDPRSGALRVYASPGAMDDLREIVSEKFQLGDGSETAWPG
jgi:hypothetical protein